MSKRDLPVSLSSGAIVYHGIQRTALASLTCAMALVVLVSPSYGESGPDGRPPEDELWYLGESDLGETSAGLSSPQNPSAGVGPDSKVSVNPVPAAIALPWCSTTGNCSIIAQGGQGNKSTFCSAVGRLVTCSVFKPNDPSKPAESRCSVMGTNGSNKRCSVGWPGEGGGRCSVNESAGRAGEGDGFHCSLRMQGERNENNKCSVVFKEAGPGKGNSCSVYGRSIDPQDVRTCSIFDGTGTRFCSVENAQGAMCSVFWGGERDHCSIIFEAAPGAKCSVGSGSEQATCSASAVGEGESGTCSIAFSSQGSCSVTATNMSKARCSAIELPGVGKPECSVGEGAGAQTRCSIIEDPEQIFCSVDNSQVADGGGGRCSVFVQLDGAPGPIGDCTIFVEPAQGIECSMKVPVGPGEETRCSVHVDSEGVIPPGENGRCRPTKPRIDEPQDGSTTNDPTPTISGSCDSGFTVHVFADDIEVGTTVATLGSFSFVIASGLPDGEHSIFVIGERPDGSFTEPSNIVHIIVDTLIGTPTIDDPANDSVTRDNTPAIAGSGTDSGATVQVYVDGTLIGFVTADGTGGFTLFVLTSLGEGPHTVFAA